MSEGILTHNRLFWATQKNKKCAKGTFDKFLKKLVDDQRILKNKSGKQTVEYSLPKNLSSLTKSINDSLDQFNEEVEKSQLDGKSLEKFLIQIQNSKQKRTKFYQQIVSMVTNILKIIKFVAVSISLGILSKMTTTKLRKLAKNYNLRLDQILNAIKKIDSKLHLAIISRVTHETNLI